MKSISKVKFNSTTLFKQIPNKYQSVFNKAEFSHIMGKRFLGGLPEFHVNNLIKKGKYSTLTKQFNKLRNSKLHKSQTKSEEYTKKFGNIKSSIDFETLLKTNPEFKKIITDVEKSAKSNGKLRVFGNTMIITGGTFGVLYMYNKIENYREEMIGCIKNTIKDNEIVKCKIIKASCNNPKVGNLVNRCDVKHLPTSFQKHTCMGQTHGCINCEGWDETDENVFYQCNEDYTFNQALSDVVVSVGDTVVDAAVGIGKYIWYIIGLVVFIVSILVCSFVIKTINKVATDETQPPMKK